MDTMNIALPAAMKQFVQEQVRRGGYSSVSEYIRDLIRRDQKEAVQNPGPPCAQHGVGVAAICRFHIASLVAFYNSGADIALLSVDRNTLLPDYQIRQKRSGSGEPLLATAVY